MVRLSVIIPGYNTPNWQWKRCLQSVVSACEPDDEIICVDDGSKIKPTIDNLNLSDQPRIRWIFLEKNEGQSVARNRALEVAQGEWVTFVDSDDEIVHDIYARSFAARKECACDIVVFGIRTIYCNDGLMAECSLRECNYGTLSTNALKEIVTARLFDEPVNKIYRRNFLNENGIRFPVGICPGEDAMFVLQCVLKRARWISIQGVGYLYYRMDGTTLSRYFPNYVATLRYWKKKWDEYLTGLGRGYDGWFPTAGFSEKWIASAQWNNIWKRGSPYSLYERWRYLRANPEICGGHVIRTFLIKSIYTFLRLHFYLRPIRRWHLMRLRPDIRQWPEKGDE